MRCCALTGSSSANCGSSRSRCCASASRTSAQARERPRATDRSADSCEGRQRRFSRRKRALRRIDDEQRSLVAQIEARIEELTRVKVEGIRRSIQASITRLEAQSEEKRQERLYVEQEIGQLEALASDPGAFEQYPKAIRAALAAVDHAEQAGKATKALGTLLGGLAITREHIRIALSGAVNRSAPGSPLSVLAPVGGRKANPRPPALIEDCIPLPGRFLLSDPARITSLHEQAGLSAKQIASRLGVSHSAVLAALGRLGIACEAPRNGHALRGQVPFGWDLQDARLVKNGAEQQVIRLIRQLQGGGESLNAIARELNRRLVPTKNAGLWQANTVGKILHRFAARAAS